MRGLRALRTRTAGAFTACLQLYGQTNIAGRSIHISPHAVIGRTTTLFPGTTISRFAEVGEHCVLGRDVIVMQHALVDDNTTIGTHTMIHPYSMLGHSPQDMKYQGGTTSLSIGSNCIIRPNAKIERGTELGGGKTYLGDNVHVMAGAYIGHDTSIEDDVTIANNVSIGGHCELHRGCTIGGHAALHQYVRIGQYAMVGGTAAVVRDVPPYTLVIADAGTAQLRGLNVRKLWPRLGFSGRRAALDLFTLIFASDADARAKAALRFHAHGHAPAPALQTRIAAVEHVDILRAVARYSRAGVPETTGRDASVLREVVDAIAQFVRDSRRGLHVPEG